MKKETILLPAEIKVLSDKVSKVKQKEAYKLYKIGKLKV